MNILLITNHLNIGGITSYCLTLGAGLKNRAHNVFIASSGGQLVSKFTQAGIKFIPIPIRTKSEASPKIGFSLMKLSGQIKKNNIELVHSHSRTTQVLGCLLHRFQGVAHVSTCHGFFKRRFHRRIFPCWGQKVIAISEEVKKHLVEDFKVDGKNIIVINNGIDIGKFGIRNTDDRIRKRLELGLGDDLVVGIVARLSDVKGHKYLVEAMKSVLEKFPKTKLLIVGEGKEKPGLINLTKGLGIENNVSFMPEVEDTQEVLSLMDIFVTPSLKEGLGLALMEAMASGLAVVGSDVGGIRSLIRDKQNGLLVRSADSNALKSAISELLVDPAKRESLGREAKNFISQNFSQEKMVAETERVYAECLSVKY